MRFARRLVPPITAKTYLTSNSVTLGSADQLSNIWLAFLPLKISRATLTCDGQHYCDMALANLVHDKFIALGSSLPSLDCSPLPVDEFPPDFYISVDKVEKVLRSSKIQSSSGLDKISA